MPHARASRHLPDRSPEDVWARVGDFTAPEWLAGVRCAEVRGQGVGAVRVLRVPGGVTLTEVLEAEGPPTLTWRQEDGSPIPVKNYVTTLSVEASPDGGATVTWDATFDPDDVPEEQLVRMMQSMQQDMLRGV